jgi:hypothetical protein
VLNDSLRFKELSEPNAERCGRLAKSINHKMKSAIANSLNREMSPSGAWGDR